MECIEIEALHKLAVGTRLLAHCVRIHPPHDTISRTITNHPFLHSLVRRTHDGYDTTALEADMSERLSGGSPSPHTHDNETNDNDPHDHPHPPQPHTTRHSKHDRLRIILPSTRSKLRGVRLTPNSPLLTSPDDISKTIADHYGANIWSKRVDEADKEAIAAYLSSYDKTIPPDMLPRLPSVQTIAKKLQEPRNSGVGPDGMPFAFYRNLSDLLAPIFARATAELAAGVKPLKGFNLGDLCAFAKDHTMAVTKLRPITLNNVDNRTVASFVSDAIMPAADAVIEAGQAGFIKSPNRRGRFNIRRLTDFFYQAVEAGLPYYVLFIDTAKAFDSIDHVWIFAVLEKIGMPEWVMNIVRALMYNVKVRPRVGAQTLHLIVIFRGVKQGCPLSPVLFAFAYDPFLRKTACPP